MDDIDRPKKKLISSSTPKSSTKNKNNRNKKKQKQIPYTVNAFNSKNKKNEEKSTNLLLKRKKFDISK